MQTITIPVRLSTDVFMHWTKSKEKAEKEVKKAVALQLFRERRLSFGKAADLAEMPLADFMDLTREQKIPLADYSEGELRTEIKLSKALARKIKGG